MSKLILSLALLLAACSSGPSVTETTRSLDPSAEYKIVFERPHGRFDNCRPGSAQTADIADDGKLIYLVGCIKDSGQMKAGPGNLVMVDLKHGSREKVILRSFLADDPAKNLPTIEFAKFLPDGRVLVVCRPRVRSNDCAEAKPEPVVRTILSALDPVTGAVAPLARVMDFSPLNVTVLAKDRLVVMSGSEPGPTNTWNQHRFVLFDILPDGQLQRRNEEAFDKLGCPALTYGCVTRKDGAVAFAARHDDTSETGVYGLDGSKLETMRGSFPFPSTQSVAFDPEGGLVYATWVTVYPPTTAFEFRDFNTGQAVFTQPLTGEYPNELKFLPGGKLAVLYGLGDRLDIWDVGLRRKLQTIGSRAQQRGLSPELIASNSGVYIGWSVNGQAVMIAERH